MPTSQSKNSAVETVDTHLSSTIDSNQFNLAYDPAPVSAVEEAVAFTVALGARISAIACEVKIRAPGSLLANVLIDIPAISAAETKKSSINAENLLVAFQGAAEKRGVFQERILERCLTSEVPDVLVEYPDFEILRLHLYRKLILSINVPTKTITGPINLVGINPQNRVAVPVIVELSVKGLGPLGNGDGVSVMLEGKYAGRILIAAGGRATAKLNTTSNGGSASVLETSESLIIAIGGDGAIPQYPSTMPYGANGTLGGSGGVAIAAGSDDGNVIYAAGGRGANGSPGQIGIPATNGFTIFWLPDFRSLATWASRHLR